MADIDFVEAPRFDRSLSLQVEASHVSAGAVLFQAGDLGVKPVSFCSRKFNCHQLNYSTIEKEALALIWALKHSTQITTRSPF